jgi:AcrR family transcriptional regulator
MPRYTLTREQIVRTAMDLLDREGLEGLNMRALGEGLGSAATAMYWHVGSKEHLIELAADAAWQEIPLPDLATVNWRAAAASMATELRAMMVRHPWLLQAFGSHLLYGPGKARHDDHGLAIFEGAGFAGESADQAAATVLTYVLGNALGDAASAAFRRKLSREGGNPDDQWRESLAGVRELASQFPRLRARLDNPAADYGAAPEGSFAFGLQAVLDGLEKELKRQSADARSSARATAPHRLRIPARR